MTDASRAQLVQAYNWIKAGKKQQAEKLLISVLQQHPENADAWWLLANALNAPAEQEEALQEVLKLRPGDEKAQKMLARFAPPPPAPVEEDDPFADLLETTSPPADWVKSTSSKGSTADFDDDPFGVGAEVDDDPFAEVDAKPNRRPADAPVAAKPKAKSQEKAHWNPWALGAIGCFGLLFLLCGAGYVTMNQLGQQMSGVVNNMMDEIVNDPTFVAAMAADPTLAAAMLQGGYNFGTSDTLPSQLSARGSIQPGQSVRATVDTYVSDSWSFQASAGQSYIIEVNAMDNILDPMVAIYNHDNQLIAENDDISFASNTNSRVEFTAPQSATYTIVVSAFGSGGDYELRVR
ncbi:MAG: pre-peptidase C-terminal domain-containing protein [Anaerolineae bacterium]|nr:pre-peptidase C-terminal domain-containing protein [Anaerolineae bacterium]